MKRIEDSLRIGTLTLDNRLVLGPMAGVTDLPYRLLCREQGAGLVVTEMISAKGLLYKNRGTREMLKTDPGEHPVSLQLFGNDPAVLSEVTQMLEDEPFACLDFNMGCPVPKVVKNGEGSALMLQPELAADCVRAMVNATKRPVTVKIRAGFDEGHKNAVEVAKRLEDAGAAAVAVHGRTREQYYSGEADLTIIRDVKAAVTIPVIGNGDLKDRKSAQEMLDLTDCDGLMFARSARGNPWVFRQVLEAGYEPTREEREEMILRHARRLVAHKGERIAMHEMRAHTAWYCKGYPGSAGIRRMAGQLETYDDLERLLSLTKTIG